MTSFTVKIPPDDLTCTRCSGPIPFGDWTAFVNRSMRRMIFSFRTRISISLLDFTPDRWGAVCGDLCDACWSAFKCRCFNPGCIRRLGHRRHHVDEKGQRVDRRGRALIRGPLESAKTLAGGK